MDLKEKFIQNAMNALYKAIAQEHYLRYTKKSSYKIRNDWLTSHYNGDSVEECIYSAKAAAERMLKIESSCKQDSKTALTEYYHRNSMIDLFTVYARVHYMRNTHKTAEEIIRSEQPCFEGLCVDEFECAEDCISAAKEAAERTLKLEA